MKPAPPVATSQPPLPSPPATNTSNNQSNSDSGGDDSSKENKENNSSNDEGSKTPKRKGKQQFRSVVGITDFKDTNKVWQGNNNFNHDLTNT
ncbi:hypothetical protein DPMN_068865 [Dreissena polymorpha]|uniref:Uncharacterized protein n=1 Tax=Dreissena polymorpha TaxID=45954 RepID=A0A9D3YXZ3_DREPO|nr:hypothetical protein DPMN_068865 [Dreissena polymorpha]